MQEFLWTKRWLRQRQGRTRQYSSKVLCVKRYNLRSPNSIKALPASKNALSTLRSKCKRSRISCSVNSGISTAVTAIVAVAGFCKEGRRQRVEGRRKEFDPGSNPAQILSTKSEIMVGDSDACSMIVTGRERKQYSFCLLPSALCLSC